MVLYGSLLLKKSSDAGSTMFVVRKGYGKKYINDIKLK